MPGSCAQITMAGDRSHASKLTVACSFMMHAGSDNPTEPNPFGGADNKRFTNILRDTRANPTNFFDTSREDNGVCRGRSQGGLVTYNSSWSAITRDGLIGGAKQSLANGGILVGDGERCCYRLLACNAEMVAI